MQRFHLNTTADLQRLFLTDETKFETASSCQFSDAEGYIVDEVLVAYEPGVRAKPKGNENAPVVVGVGLQGSQECEIPNFKGSFLGRFPLVSAGFWTSDHLSERSRSVDAFPERARAEHSR